MRQGQRSWSTPAAASVIKHGTCSGTLLAGRQPALPLDPPCSRGPSSRTPPLLCTNTTLLFTLIPLQPRNFFTYTPLLPAMCVGTVEERSIVEPVRAVLGSKVGWVHMPWQLSWQLREAGALGSQRSFSTGLQAGTAASSDARG